MNVFTLGPRTTADIVLGACSIEMIRPPAPRPDAASPAQGKRRSAG